MIMPDEQRLDVRIERQLQRIELNLRVLRAAWEARFGPLGGEKADAQNEDAGDSAGSHGDGLKQGD